MHLGVWVLERGPFQGSGGRLPPVEKLIPTSIVTSILDLIEEHVLDKLILIYVKFENVNTNHILA